MISGSDRLNALELIDEAVANGASFDRAAELIGIDVRTYYRWKQKLRDTGSIEDLRPSIKHSVPINKLSDNERELILEIINSAKFRDKSPTEIVHTLLDECIYICSESTIYRILHEEDLCKHRSRSAPPTHRAIPTHSASGPNQVWMWDITYIPGPIKGEFFYLYLISDLFSRFIVGYEVWEVQSADNASILVERAVNSQHVLSKDKLVIHSDNGSPMTGSTMLATFRRLGIISSYSRPRVSNDNAYAESIFRTLKYCSTFKFNGYESLQECRDWVHNFVKLYNYEHHHSGINYLTPNERHNCDWRGILAERKKVLEAAKQKNPERWNNREVRDCTAPEIVYLNPVNTEPKQKVHTG